MFTSWNSFKTTVMVTSVRACRRDVMFYNLIQGCTSDRAKTSKNVSHQKDFKRISMLGK